MKFYTQFGETRPKGSKEVFNKPSMTEPDNAMSIPEIIAKYTRGQGIAVNQYQWTSGQSAPEYGEQLTDKLEDVLELPKPAPAAAPASAAAAPAATAPAPAAALAAAAPGPATEPAPAGSPISTPTPAPAGA